MALADTVLDAVKKVAKAMPDSTKKFVKEASEKVGNSTVLNSPIAKGTFKKGESSWLLNYNEKAFKPVEFLPGSHYSLKKRYAMGIPLAGAAISAAGGARTMQKDAKLSDMQADEMSNMVNISRSPNIDSYEKRRNPENRSKEELRDAKRDTAYGLRTGNAAGDLVFALHDLKGGSR